MDDFQPEDELKPDTSDRPAPRGKKPTPTSKLPISKQHLMIAIGILVLLLLVLGIGSALNSSSSPEKPAESGSERNIDLSGNTAANSEQPTPNSDTSSATESTAAQTSPDATPSQTTMPDSSPSASTTDSPAPSPVAAANLPTAPATLDRNAKLSNVSTQPAVVPHPVAPTTQAPVRHTSPPAHHARAKAEPQRSEPRHTAPVERRQPEHREAPVRRDVPVHRDVVSTEKPAVHKTTPVVVKQQHPAVTTVTEHPAKAPVVETTPSNIAPAAGKGYTLQLSSASREDTLNAWAKQQNLSGYRVYKTTRNGQPWYVLVSGSYKTPAEAKSAISTLPEAVKAKSPWVKPLSQMH